MKTSSLKRGWLAVGGLVCWLTSSPQVLAQWASQTNVLSPGWNAIYLEVQPEPSDPDAVFAGLAVESVWTWNRKAGEPQFVQDVNTLVPRQPEWLTYFPSNHPQRSLGNLFSIQGGRGILVRYTGATSIQWVATGRPVLPRADWLPDTPNLVGFHVSESAPPTFQNYLINSTTHAGSSIYYLSSAGRWTLTNTAATIQRGKSYWVQTIGNATFGGSTYVEPEQNLGLDFGSFAPERRLLLRNDGSNVTRTVTIRPSGSLPRPLGATYTPAYAGQPLLSYWDFTVTNQTNIQIGWKPFTAPISVTLGSGEETTLRFATRRKDFAASIAPPGVSSSYQGTLEVTDNSGGRVVVPVSASLPANDGLIQAASGQGGSGTSRAGLWVGMVAVTNVSWVGAPSTNIINANPAFNFGDRTTPRRTSSEFQFKIILHVDAGGQVRLLQKVMEVWSNGSWAPDPRNPGLSLPGTPGSYRLFTDESLAAAYTGAALRDGKPVARRLSTPVFALREPQLMTKVGEFGAGTVSCNLLTGYDDNLNPFKHQYHPDHDNYTPGYSAKFPAGVESYDIHRDVRLEFLANDPSGLNPPGWQDLELGGNYREAVSGVHRDTINVFGGFRLRRVSTVAILN